MLMAADIPPTQPMIETVVIQPTAFCNIACTYCYLPSRNERGVMEQATVRTIFERIFESNYAAPELTVIWHAGEPLAAGLDFYQQAFAAIASLCPSHIRIVHSFQTNGMLLTDAWCDLIEQWEVHVGVSVDGPKALHDTHRVTRKGLGTFDRTMDGIRLLQSRGIPFHALSVLSAISLTDPQGMHDFYADAGIDRVCFNIEESEGEHVSSLLDQGNLDQTFRSFLENFWRIAKAGGKVGFVREIDAMISRIFSPAEALCRNPQTEPLAMLNIDRFGHVSTYSPELLGYKNAEFNDFIIGDIRKNTLREIYADCLKSKLHAAISEGVRKCAKECGYYQVCGGGAPVNKLFETGTFAATRTGYCRLTQMVPTDIILDAIDRLETTFV
jgi:uncharacterized protein